ncbi:MAG: helix-hairpin-helix domain-containing protein [candidate division WOR-3 bacterium]
MGRVISKKCLIVLILIFKLKIFSTTFFSSDLNFCNIFEDLLPFNKNVSYNYLTFGCSNRFLIKDLNNFYSLSNYNFKKFSFGHLLISDFNNIYRGYNLSLKGAYNATNIKIGISPYVSFKDFCDSVNNFKFGLIVSGMIKEENFYIISSYFIKEYKNGSIFLIGYSKNEFDIQFETFYRDGFVFTGKVAYQMYDNFKVNVSLDSEKRIFFGLQVVKFPYMIEYSNFVHPYFSVSNDIRFSLYRENKYYTLQKIKTNKVTFDIPVKAKKIKGFIKKEKINLNGAFYEEILSLEGLSKTVLRRIYIYRLINGKINSYDELEKLPGIGKKSIEKLKEQTFIGD